MSTSIVKELMDLPSSVMIGSRGLGLDKWEDTDIAVLDTELPARYSEYDWFDLTKYFAVIPLGNHYLIKTAEKDGSPVDIIVFTTVQALDNVSDAMFDMHGIPKYMLNDKDTRVHLYEMALKVAIGS